MSVCVPALPKIREAFGASHATTQYAITAFLLGLALFQPVHGPLADRFGRRKVLLASFAVSAVASLGLVYARGIRALIALRFAQGAGVAAGTVTARAMVRDSNDAPRAARILALVASITAVAPALGPPIGGALVDRYAWSSVFVATFVAIVCLWILAFRNATETLDPRKALPLNIGSLTSAFFSLLRQRNFVAYSGVFGFGTAAFYVFIAVAPSLFQEHFQTSASVFGLMWMGLSLAYMIGASISARFVRRYEAASLLRAGAFVMLLSGMGLPLATRVLGESEVTVLVPMALLLIGQGMASPLALAGAVETRPDLAGTASGLSSSIGMAISGAAAAVGGTLYDGHALGMSLGVAATTVACAACAFSVRSPTFRRSARS